MTAKLCKVAIGGWSLQKISGGFPTIWPAAPKADFSAMLRALAAGEGIVGFEGAIVLDAAVLHGTGPGCGRTSGDPHWEAHSLS